ncbi:signal transduction histidine kinase [Thermocatellispora tengchongensis]|uniref:histidine kinase n=1 Tax=Thermocatellispora tengchongensis TaxID=1073253 RepID=A0A840PA40_9ACTN|nr:sensor histidine kinase [Thermocatellispora tengchongensis]MBB5134721.1 signal transduction histidine kinase [Thermocatellispora tengchongensis]
MPALNSKPAVAEVARSRVVARARQALDALEHLVGGLGTSILALVMLFWLALTAVSCLVGVGLLLVPSALRAVRIVADRERGRLSRWGPQEIIGPGPVPSGLRAALADPAVWRELRWVPVHATMGFFLGLLGMALPLYAVRDGTFPLWWRLVPPDVASAQLGWWTVEDWPGALAVGLWGMAWIVVTLLVAPGMARLQAWPGRRLLAPDPGADLALRVAHLTATRAAALDAHAAELRRIERSLHDGTQNRLVAVTVLLGAARRALARDPAAADAALERAQGAAEQALAELRGVVRSILPPVLDDRSLPDALAALAADCPVPCHIDADVPGRCAASVEATAYFVVAEALTNIARHSHASRATVTVRREDERLCLSVADDGRGGADAEGGSGLGGIRRRIDAHDGTFVISSPPGGPTVLTVSLPCGS